MKTVIVTEDNMEDVLDAQIMVCAKIALRYLKRTLNATKNQEVKKLYFHNFLCSLISNVLINASGCIDNDEDTKMLAIGVIMMDATSRTAKIMKEIAEESSKGKTLN